MDIEEKKGDLGQIPEKMLDFFAVHFNNCCKLVLHISRYVLFTLEIDTLFHTAIILNCFSFHDSSLTAAWAGHRLLCLLKQL